jgi:hypothetical protein
MKKSEITVIVKREWIPSPLPPVKVVKPNWYQKRKMEVADRIYGRV